MHFKVEKTTPELGGIARVYMTESTNRVGWAPDLTIFEARFAFENSILLLGKQKTAFPISAYEPVKSLSKGATKYDFKCFQLVFFFVKK